MFNIIATIIIIVFMKIDTIDYSRITFNVNPALRSCSPPCKAYANKFALCSCFVRQLIVCQSALQRSNQLRKNCRHAPSQV